MQLKKYMPNLIAPHISPYSHFVRTTCINITVPNAWASHILMSKKQTDFTSALNPNNQFIKSNMLISPLIHITDTHCLLNRRNNSQIPKRCPQAVCSQYLTWYRLSEISMSAYKNLWNTSSIQSISPNQSQNNLPWKGLLLTEKSEWGDGISVYKTDCIGTATAPENQIRKAPNPVPPAFITGNAPPKSLFHHAIKTISHLKRGFITRRNGPFCTTEKPLPQVNKRHSTSSSIQQTDCQAIRTHV